MIQEQNVDYSLALAMEGQEDSVLEIDRDIICHTLQGKPIKPKTVGQKKYVDAIRRQMIVFGLGPAGTGKTYLAMAMAITAVRLLRRERSWGSCREICRARSIPISGRCMTLCIRSWERKAS